MGFRNITEREFDLILSELTDLICEISLGETFIGYHARCGAVTLVRDGSGCIGLAEEMTHFDNFLARQRLPVNGGAVERE